MIWRFYSDGAVVPFRGQSEPAARQHAATKDMSLARLLDVLAFLGRDVQPCTSFLEVVHGVSSCWRICPQILFSERRNTSEASRCTIDLVGVLLSDL